MDNYLRASAQAVPLPPKRVMHSLRATALPLSTASVRYWCASFDAWVAQFNRCAVNWVHEVESDWTDAVLIGWDWGPRSALMFRPRHSVEESFIILRFERGWREFRPGSLFARWLRNHAGHVVWAARCLSLHPYKHFSSWPRT